MRGGCGERQARQQDQEKTEGDTTRPQAHRHGGKRRQRRQITTEQHAADCPRHKARAPGRRRCRRPASPRRRPQRWPARRRSGHSLCAMLQTAWATIATATSWRPCRIAVSVGPCILGASCAKAKRRTADGRVKPAQAARAPAQPARRSPHQQADLAAGGAWQHLAEGDQAGIFLGGEPAALAHIGPLEIAQMRDGAAKRCQAEAQGDPKHLVGGRPADRGGGASGSSRRVVEQRHEAVIHV